ncbi:MAG: protein kinase, partial [Burkholderiaceae bacterium]
MDESQDPDKTIVKSIVDLPGAGADAKPAAASADGALPVGTRLGEFLISGLLRSGPVGHVYLAQDYSLGRTVALKEYMPTALAMRMDGGAVQARSPRQADAFASGLISFINEARKLARFDHPALVKVHRFWEAHDTAYMVMPWYEGQTLEQALAAMDTPPSEAWLKALLAPLLDALQLMHEQQCFHCGIAPDTILLQKDGRPVLLDSGSTRQALGEAARDPHALLKAGYAPLELYTKDAGVHPGPWTDLYALAASARFAILGQMPLPSVQRIVDDTLQPLAEAARGRYGDSFLQALDQAMELAPERRPQSAPEMRLLLGLDAASEASARPTSAPVPAAAPLRSRGPRHKAVWIGVAALLLAIGAGVLLMPKHGSETAIGPALPQDVAAAAPLGAASVPGATPMPMTGASATGNAALAGAAVAASAPETAGASPQEPRAANDAALPQPSNAQQTAAQAGVAKLSEEPSAGKRANQASDAALASATRSAASTARAPGKRIATPAKAPAPATPMVDSPEPSQASAAAAPSRTTTTAPALHPPVADAA